MTNNVTCYILTYTIVITFHVENNHVITTRTVAIIISYDSIIIEMIFIVLMSNIKLSKTNTLKNETVII